MVNIADNEAAKVEMRLEDEINAVKGSVSDEDASIEALLPRISPYGSAEERIPEINARFLDSTGSDNFPNSLAAMTTVSSSNPRFTLGNIALFVAVPAISGVSYVLKNITQDTETNIDRDEASVTLGGKLLC